MKAFHFSLQRALEWRNSRLSMEEAKLERLRGAVRELHRALEQLSARRLASGHLVNRAGAVQGSEFGALEAFCQWVKREEQATLQRIRQASAAVAAQQDVVVRARRDARLLERLKARRQAAWKKEEEHEMENLAGEFAIGQWRRNDALQAKGDDIRHNRSR